MNTSTPAPRRNVIVIFTDDQRYDAAGYTGNRHIQTPHLDALAARAVRFSNAFVTLSICSPSRAALLTGRYGSANGVTNLGGGLNIGERTFAHALREAGYHTGLVGKWHLANSPQECGFEDATYFVSNGSYYNRKVLERGEEIAVEQHIESYNARQAIDFIQRAAERDEPFALFLCPQLPHLDHRHKWDARPETLARYEKTDLPLPASWNDDLSGKPPYLQSARSRVKAIEDYGYDDGARVRQHTREYYAVITDLDAALGQVLAAVEEMGLRDDTMIIVMGDNGWFVGEHRLTSKVLPYEESMRVPLFVYAPGMAPRAETRMVLNIDLAPTILEWAGAPRPQNLHGRSLLPLLRGETTAWRTSFLYEAPQGELGIRPNFALRTERWKYIATFADGATHDAPVFEELYDLHDDPHEMTNRIRAAEYRETTEQLKTELEQQCRFVQRSHF